MSNGSKKEEVGHGQVMRLPGRKNPQRSTERDTLFEESLLDSALPKNSKKVHVLF